MRMWNRMVVIATMAAMTIAIVATLPAAAVTEEQKLQRTLQFRRGFGLESSMAVVKESWADREKYSDMGHGLPLTPAEAAELDRRRDIVWAIGPAKDVARARDGYSDMYIDQHNGGIPVFLYTGDIATQRAAIAEVMPDGIDFEVKKVEYTIKQLRAKQNRITKDMLETEWVLDGDIPLAQVGFDVSENRVLVGLERAGDEARARQILQDRYGPMVDVEFIGPSENDSASTTGSS